MRAILAAHVPEYEVYAFGSRVRGAARRYSDLDLTILADSLPTVVRVALREALDDSGVVPRVDVSVWGDVAEAYRRTIRPHWVRVFPE
ncbi:MAG: nucleotidyltransferase domain-containing protein [Fimbriimonadaceae bacterium]|nr:nucleotidyltransferase domain-containing protein [Fimbriimonadaceae bacterium]